MSRNGYPERRFDGYDINGYARGHVKEWLGMSADARIFGLTAGDWTMLAGGFGLGALVFWLL